MFGIRFIKAQPTTYLLQYSNGKLKREGRGLAFFYYAPFTTLISIPLESADVPFIFEQITADFQEVTLQGQVTYRIVNPKQLAELLNFTIDSKGRYTTTDSEKLSERVLHVVQVLIQTAISQLSLRQTLTSAEVTVQKVLNGLMNSKEINALGLEILGLSLLAIKPNPETSRALEADVREQLLKEADQAIYARRNAAVEQERAIKENELNTEIAVENKKRQIREAQMDAERAVQEKKRQLQEAEMASKIELERRNTDLVQLETENLKRQADAQAYTLTVSIQALAGMEPHALQALASMKMNPNQLIALAFRDLADGAKKIGQLNVTPDLLKEILRH